MEPVNTCISVSADLDDDNLTKSKLLLSRHGSRYALPPHITIATVPVPARNHTSAKAALEELLQLQECFQIVYGGLSIDRKRRYFYVPVRSEDIRRLHHEVLMLLYRYRECCIRRKDLNRIREHYYTDQELANLFRYGNSRVDQLYVFRQSGQAVLKSKP